jgi:hypothetical protein
MLLSVWEAIGSPIRCLDEFDVFMDNVNRAISTNMLVGFYHLVDNGKKKNGMMEANKLSFSRIGGCRSSISIPTVYFDYAECH